MSKSVITVFIVMILGVSFQAQASSGAQKQLERYQRQGVTEVNPEMGKKLWYSRNNGRSCTTCHGQSPAQVGQHVKTKKRIQPMLVSQNPKRFQNSKKVEKWFLRNCKWTLGRQCTVQEKANILSWLNN